jgi:hypothetical protein
MRTMAHSGGFANLMRTGLHLMRTGVRVTAVQADGMAPWKS